MSRRQLPAAAIACGLLLPAWPSAAGAINAEEALRAAWVGRHVVLRTAAHSNCDARYTNNRVRASQVSSGGRHRFDPGEIGRVDSLHLQRARIDVLMTLVEPLRVELRDGPFQLFEQVECRVELQVPAQRDAVRRGATDVLDGLLGGLLEGPAERTEAQASPLWNRRRVEPLPADYEERLAAYRAWKEEQLYLALRGRLAEALDRASDVASRTERSRAYAEGFVTGARDVDPDHLYSAGCDELPGQQLGSGWESPPDDLDDGEARDWKDGYQDGRQLRFEIALARRLERCLP